MNPAEGRTQRIQAGGSAKFFDSRWREKGGALVTVCLSACL